MEYKKVTDDDIEYFAIHFFHCGKCEFLEEDLFDMQCNCRDSEYFKKILPMEIICDYFEFKDQRYEKVWQEFNEKKLSPDEIVDKYF